MPEWLDNFQHSSITDENRESFTSAMGKYNTSEDALVGGFNAMKEAGRNYKLPKSVESLPDEKMRGEFVAQARELLGVSPPVLNAEELADVDFKNGNGEVDDGVVNMLKTFAVEKKWPKSTVTGIVELFNTKFTPYLNQAVSARAEAIKKESADKTNQALIEHYGSKEKVAEQSELLRRAFKNKAGLSAEEYEKVGDALADSVLTKDPVMARAILTLIAPLAAEADTETGEGGGKKKEEKPKTLAPLPKTAAALGWNDEK